MNRENHCKRNTRRILRGPAEDAAKRDRDDFRRQVGLRIAAVTVKSCRCRTISFAHSGLGLPHVVFRLVVLVRFPSQGSIRRRSKPVTLSVRHPTSRFTCLDEECGSDFIQSPQCMHVVDPPGPPTTPWPGIPARRASKTSFIPMPAWVQMPKLRPVLYAQYHMFTRHIICAYS